MSDEQDDNATVVLDINAFKDQLKKAEEAVDADLDEIAFGVHEENEKSESETESETESSEEASLEEIDDSDESGLDLDLGESLEIEEEPASPAKIVLFDYQSKFFSKFQPKLPTDNEYHLVSELKELNTFLLKKEPVIILFNYNATPKAVNQLTAQIKAKFPAAKSVILAKGLTAEKAEAHQKSKSGADAYLDYPFTMDVFTETIQKIWNS